MKHDLNLGTLPVDPPPLPPPPQAPGNGRTRPMRTALITAYGNDVYELEADAHAQAHTFFGPFGALRLGPYTAERNLADTGAGAWTAQIPVTEQPERPTR